MEAFLFLKVMMFIFPDMLTTTNAIPQDSITTLALSVPIQYITSFSFMQCLAPLGSLLMKE